MTDSREASLYRADLGMAWVNDVLAKVPFVLQQRYNYDFRTTRAEQSDVYIETEWLIRPAFPDESAVGITKAKMRIILTGQHRGRASPTIASAIRTSLQLRFEYAVTFAGSEEWTAHPFGDTMRAYVKRLENELKTVLNIQR